MIQKHEDDISSELLTILINNDLFKRFSKNEKTFRIFDAIEGFSIEIGAPCRAKGLYTKTYLLCQITCEFNNNINSRIIYTLAPKKLHCSN